MQFNILTIFPEIFNSYLDESILKRAQRKKLIHVKIHNIRDYAGGAHKVIDDRPYGGGLGMVIKIDPIFRVLQAIQKRKSRNVNRKVKIILFSPRGKMLTQKIIDRYSKLDQLIMICGRYEGIDERVNKLADEVVSVGNYVLMGGEVPAMAVIESVSRLVPGVLGVLDEIKTKPKFRIEQRKGELKERIWGFSEFPQYTRPELFSIDKRKTKLCVPKVLLSGNHKKIKEWREKKTKIIQ